MCVAEVLVVQTSGMSDRKLQKQMWKPGDCSGGTATEGWRAGHSRSRKFEGKGVMKMLGAQVPKKPPEELNHPLKVDEGSSSECHEVRRTKN